LVWIFGHVLGEWGVCFLIAQDMLIFLYPGREELLSLTLLHCSIKGSSFQFL